MGIDEYCFIGRFVQENAILVSALKGNSTRGKLLHNLHKASSNASIFKYSWLNHL